MPPKKSGRRAKTGASGTSARSRARPGARVKNPVKNPLKKATRGAGGRPSRRDPAGDVVLGVVPLASRVVGGLGAVGGLLLGVAVLLPRLTVGNEQVVVADSVAGTVAAWIWPAVIVAAGVSVALGHYPRLGLSALGVAAAVSTAGLLGELYWASEDAARGRYEIIAGARLLTSTVHVRAGWYVGVAGLTVLILVGIAVAWLWARVVMDDGESLDPGRPLLGGLAAVSGVFAVLCLSATLVSIPDQVTITQQAIAGQLRPLESLVPVEGAIGLLGRPGLALTGGLLGAAVLVLYSMFATTLRPRLAVVGALGAFTGYTLGLAAQALVDAAKSAQIEVSIGGWGLPVVCLAYAGLTFAALRWRPPARALSGGIPMRAASRRALKSGVAGRSQPSAWRG